MYNIIFPNTIQTLNNIDYQSIYTDILQDICRHNTHTDILLKFNRHNTHTDILQDISCQYMGAGHVQAYLSVDAQAAKTATLCCK